MLPLIIILTWLVGSAAAYRSTAFVHEIIHQRHNRRFPELFTIYWNCTSGTFALLSQYEFRNHLRHHQPGVFGTKKDEQYPLIRSNTLLAFGLFFLLPVFLPLVNLIKSLLFPFKELFFETCDLSEEKVSLYFYRWVWTFIFLVLSLKYHNLFVVWYCISIGGWYLSTLRVPLEHELRRHKSTTTILDQAIDSKDYKRSLFSFIIQPLGLNYHRLHHRFPRVPYHNLHKLALEEGD